jgi:hypothetical protein
VPLAFFSFFPVWFLYFSSNTFFNSFLVSMRASLARDESPTTFFNSKSAVYLRKDQRCGERWNWDRSTWWA